MVIRHSASRVFPLMVDDLVLVAWPQPGKGVEGVMTSEDYDATPYSLMYVDAFMLTATAAELCTLRCDSLSLTQLTRDDQSKAAPSSSLIRIHLQFKFVFLLLFRFPLDSVSRVVFLFLVHRAEFIFVWLEKLGKIF